MLEGLSVFKDIAENVIIFGGAFTAIAWGLRHVWKLIRNVEKLVEESEKNSENQARIADELAKHIQAQQDNDHKRDLALKDLGAGFSSLSHDLHGHTTMEEKRDLIRDEQLLHIIREISPNGGSSMKDVLNAAKTQLNDVHTRVSVLEQWKEDRPRTTTKKTTPKKRTK
jgi:hypothetical protein